MTSKIIAVLFTFSIFLNIQLLASEVEQPPSWITVDYADLYNQSVSEYQLVTVTVSNYGLWFIDDNYQISVDYDPNQLVLANTTYTDSMQNRTVQAGATVAADSNNFKVSYQFYLMPNVDADIIPITITKVKNNSSSENAVVNLSAISNTAKRNIKFGDIVLSYNVTEYNNDGTNIAFNMHFDVVSNPNRQPFTLSLKKNNMKISNPDIYQVKVQFDTGTVTAIDKTNFSLKMDQGDGFDLNVTTTVSGLSAKDDRFDFFVYLQTGDQFVRISPIYYRSELQAPSTNLRVVRYSYITLAICLFFVLLTGLYFSVNIYQKNKGGLQNN